MIRIARARQSPAWPATIADCRCHDELLFEVEAGAEDKLIATAREVMEGAAEPMVRLDVPIVADAGQGVNWAVAH